MSPPDSAEVLAAVGVSKSYPGVRALDNVTLRLHRGSFIGLLGEHGAGKSTLLKILTGVESPDTAALYVCSEYVAIRNTHDTDTHIIRANDQELSVLPNLTMKD